MLINITGAHDLTLFELDEAANRIREEVDPEANIIVGSTLDTAMEGMMRVSVVATGIDATDVSLICRSRAGRWRPRCLRPFRRMRPKTRLHPRQHRRLKQRLLLWPLPQKSQLCLKSWM